MFRNIKIFMLLIYRLITYLSYAFFDNYLMTFDTPGFATCPDLSPRNQGFQRTIPGPNRGFFGNQGFLRPIRL